MAPSAKLLGFRNQNRVVFESQELLEALWEISDWFVVYVELHQACVRIWMLLAMSVKNLPTKA